MPLSMVRPFKHPRTGVYWVRKAVPEELRAAVGKRELTKTLGTKDPREAKQKAPSVVAEFEAILNAARSGHRPNRLTFREITALAGEWYREEMEVWGDDPDKFGDIEVYLESLEAQIEEDERGGSLRVSEADCAAAARLIKAHGYPYNPHSAARLARAIYEMRYKLGRTLERRQGGDWRPDTTLDRLPTLPAGRTTETAPKVTFQSLVAAWAAENGKAGKALYERQQTAKMLSTFLGHDDANRVSADDVVRWKEARLGAGKSTKSVANDIGELRPIWRWGKANRKLTFAENPFAGLAPRTKKRGKRVRGPYTEDDAARLLNAARTQKDASLRWLPWVLCFTGARIAEASQATKEDIRQTEAGVWFLYIHENGAGRSLKTEQSERQVPLHPDLIAEGFLSHVQTLPAGSPLFPDLKPDKFGSLGGTATKKHGYWVRKTVGITDPTKDPAHAWRHRFEDQARIAGVSQPITDALMGHLNAVNESEGYGRGFRFMPDTTAPWVAKMARPLSPSTANHTPL